MSDYRSTSRNDEKRVKSAVTKNVRVKKKNGIQKIAEAFIAEDVKDIKSYLIFEILVPSVKRGIEDLVHMTLYGEHAPDRRSKGGVRTPYESISRKREISRKSMNVYDYDELIFDTYAEADAALDAMYEILENYKLVRVADFYELANRTTTPNDNNYGWLNLEMAHIEKIRIDGETGYYIKLPKAMPID